MSIFQDKKILIHVSLEIVVIGTMAYFFYTKSKQMEERLKLLEEQMIKTNQILYEDINTIKQKIKKLEQKSPISQSNFNFTKSKQSLPISPKIVEIYEEEVEVEEEEEEEEEVEEEEVVEVKNEDEKLLLDKELENELNELDLI